MTIAHNPILDVNNPDFTTEFWMKGIKNQPHPLYLVVDKSHGFANGTGWAFQGVSADGGIFFGIGMGGAPIPANFPGVSSAVDVLDGNFHHIAGTWDGSTIRLYVDRVSQGTVPLSLPANNTRAMNIGFSWGGGSPQRFFRGQIDELSIYNRALSASEITDIFNAGSVGKCVYAFQGFFPPVDNLPTLNRVNAGRGIPIKFSLGGDEGLSIFAPDYPKSQAIPCASNVPVDTIEETVTAVGSMLSYDDNTDTYTYVWRTDKTWAGTCRQLIVKLKDNSEHRANFDFK